MIVLFHSSFNFYDTPLPFIFNSYLFVDLFFVLSGFVMTFAYKHKIQRGMPFKKYISLRLGRIYPLHLFMLLVWVPYILVKYYLASSGYGETEIYKDSNSLSFISNLFLIQSLGIHDNLSWNSPSWSISTEFYTYIVFFAITYFFDKRSSIILPIVISASLYSFLYSLNTGNIVFTFDYGFLRCIAGFYLGVLAFRIKSLLPLDKININTQEIGIMLCIICFISLADLSYVFISLALVAFMLAVVVFSNKNSGYIGTILSSAALRKIGLWSYSIYMTHKILVAGFANVTQYILQIELSQGFGIYSIFINIATILITIFISKYTYIHIEKRFRDIVKEKVLSH